MADQFRAVHVTRVRPGAMEAQLDRAATEEPLEIRLHGRPFAVIMRTPGADLELAAGFLFSERVLTGADDLGTIEHCTTPVPPPPAIGDPRSAIFDPQSAIRNPQWEAHPENIVNATLAQATDEALDALLAGRRQVTMTSSCGMCGRRTIDSLRSTAPAIVADWTMAATTLMELPARLRERQAVFDETGGLHAAGLFTADGHVQATAEDVGRHNAVDKIVGRKLLAEALPLSSSVLFVSGRTSFEIVQKAFLAGIPIVAAVSAPSTLAVDLARETGVTLVGFVRGQGFNVYANEWRIWVGDRT